MIRMEEGEYLSGVRYWALHFLTRTPRYEVYVYVGRDKDLGLYWFRAYEEPNVMISRNAYQLRTPYFQPFLIDHERILEAAHTKEESSDAHL